MSEVLDNALALAKQGVRLFQVQFNKKIPAVADFSHKATCDVKLLAAFFSSGQFNGGIACGKVAEGLYLVGFDIDNKPGRNGYETLAELEKQGFLLPKTWSQKTPSGGEHRLFWSRVPIRQGADTVGVGIDLRGDGGYLVSPGSHLPGGVYSVLRDLPIAPFPGWAVARFEKKATVLQLSRPVRPVEDQVTALKRASEFLRAQSPVYEGTRSHECFRVSSQLKDFGVDETQVMDLLLEYWDCQPMLDEGELAATIHNAYRYGKNPPGFLAPENLFEAEGVEEGNGDDGEPPRPTEGSPLAKLNENHFYYTAEGVSRVCWETTLLGKFHLERMFVSHFHEKLLAREIFYDGKNRPLTQVWMKWPSRRTYDGVRFDPSGKLPKNFYNLWRGFAVQPESAPRTPEAAESANLFLEHLQQNICDNDPKLTDWLVTYIAHIFQKPGEKPGVAVVLSGDKGTGKSFISEVLGHMIGPSAAIVADKQLVVGHFNAIMEDKVLLTLDEAFWSGDKSVEGAMKHLITGNTLQIIRKGHDPYSARIYNRTFIIGNETWLVPASADERRFAVFEVGNARRQDHAFFGRMWDGLTEKGGAEYLLHLFLNWDLAKANINSAPHTKGLEEQKEQSLNPIHAWWRDCLQEGKIIGSSLDTIPEECAVKDLHDAFLVHAKALNIRYLPNRISFSRGLRGVLPTKASYRTSSQRLYRLGTLENMRATWDARHGYAHHWPDPLDALL